MKMRLLAAAAAILLASAPSFAATTYYVSHMPNKKACAIVTAKPDGKTLIMVGKAGYATTAKAAAAMRASSACK